MKTEQSEKIDQLVTALVQVQANLLAAPKRSDNKYHRSTYADLPTCWDNCRGLLSENGLVIIQNGESGDGETVTLATTLAHVSGQWIRGRSSVKAKPDKETGHISAQSCTSALTYLRRYGLSAIIGQVTEDEDDDGEGAEGRGATAPARDYPPATTTGPTPDPSAVSPPAPAATPLPYAPPQVVPAPEGTPQAEVGGGQDCWAHEVHFGKNAGKSLGELTPKSLQWYQNDWQPEPWHGVISEKDTALRAALDASMGDGKKNE